MHTRKNQAENTSNYNTLLKGYSCGGELDFAAPVPVDEQERDLSALSQLAPHQAMGIPRIAAT